MEAHICVINCSPLCTLINVSASAAKGLTRNKVQIYSGMSFVSSAQGLNSFLRYEEKKYHCKTKFKKNNYTLLDMKMIWAEMVT